jgi:hypothetical protein
MALRGKNVSRRLGSLYFLRPASSAAMAHAPTVLLLLQVGNLRAPYLKFSHHFFEPARTVAFY